MPLNVPLAVYKKVRFYIIKTVILLIVIEEESKKHFHPLSTTFTHQLNCLNYWFCGRDMKEKSVLDFI